MNGLSLILYTTSGSQSAKSNTICFSATHFPIYLDSARMQQILEHGAHAAARGNGFIFGLERRATKTLSPHSGLQSAAPTTSSVAAALNPRVRSLPRPLAAPSLFRSRAPPPSLLTRAPFSFPPARPCTPVDVRNENL